jgi:hypothetical protein
MATHRIPGLAVAVARGGEIVYLRALGVRNLETGEPLVPESLFHMASVSKPFVATAIVQLVEEGKILASNYDRTPMTGIRDGVIDIVLGHEATVPRLSVAYVFARTTSTRASRPPPPSIASSRRARATSTPSAIGSSIVSVTTSSRTETRDERSRCCASIPSSSTKRATPTTASETYAKAGDRERAIASYRRALELDPASPSAKKALAKLEDPAQ